MCVEVEYIGVFVIGGEYCLYGGKFLFGVDYFYFEVFEELCVFNVGLWVLVDFDSGKFG